jgi:hypothetical protein
MTFHDGHMHVPSFAPETHYRCHCPACQWAQANAVVRFGRWLRPLAKLVLFLCLFVAMIALAVFLVVGGSAALFHHAVTGGLVP